MTALSKAAAANRMQDILSFSGAVAAGAVHAIEAGFSGKQPKALKGYQSNLLNAIQQLKSREKKQDTQQADAAALFQAFSGKAVERRSGRHKH